MRRLPSARGILLVNTGSAEMKDRECELRDGNKRGGGTHRLKKWKRSLTSRNAFFPAKNACRAREMS